MTACSLTERPSDPAWHWNTIITILPFWHLTLIYLRDVAWASNKQGSSAPDFLILILGVGYLLILKTLQDPALSISILKLLMKSDSLLWGSEICHRIVGLWYGSQK